MMFRTFLFASSLAAALAVFAPTLDANANDKDGCVLHTLKVTKVVPYRVTELAGRGSYQRLAGASLFVPAQPGLTAEWIGANVERHLRAMGGNGMPECPLAVGSVKVTVASGATGYWVQIAGRNSKAAGEILARAEQIVR